MCVLESPTHNALRLALLHCSFFVVSFKYILFVYVDSLEQSLLCKSKYLMVCIWRCCTDNAVGVFFHRSGWRRVGEISTHQKQGIEPVQYTFRQRLYNLYPLKSNGCDLSVGIHCKQFCYCKCVSAFRSTQSSTKSGKKSKMKPKEFLVIIRYVIRAYSNKFVWFLLFDLSIMLHTL